MSSFYLSSILLLSCFSHFSFVSLTLLFLSLLTCFFLFSTSLLRWFQGFLCNIFIFLSFSKTWLYYISNNKRIEQLIVKTEDEKKMRERNEGEMKWERNCQSFCLVPDVKFMISWLDSGWIMNDSMTMKEWEKTSTEIWFMRIRRDRRTGSWIRN